MKRALLVALAVAVVAFITGGFLDVRQFLASYLFAWLFWLGIALGSVALLMLHDVTGGKWGDAVRRPLGAAALTIPLIAILFMPIVLGVHVLYPWTHVPTQTVGDRSAYLNVPFFAIRALFYFACWIALAVAFAWRRARAAPWAGGGLVLYFVTMTFAAWDWMMSLEPHWWSTIYGMSVITGQGLSALAVMALVAATLSRADDELLDLGNMLLAFIIFWAYLAFSQFLLIWAGNMKVEIAWYLPRTQTSWVWLAIAILIFYFFAPFFALLFRFVKKNNILLGAIAAGVLIMRMADLYWTVGPAFHPQYFFLSWMDVVAQVAFGGVWLLGFRWLLGRAKREVVNV
ncbi:MAG: hypothetical protein M3041_03160 [Acidobacteriota bacterium]|nr:hypothetical protein [Acidobacteriota bacterium]